MEDLPVLEDHVFGEDIMEISVWDSYETAIEEDWAQFINIEEAM
ncbi:hypothetical protein FACS1894187_11990 [Synergistales bacterium]|nr:hypothetical protein FACS1894187_11990 [Synergistales bacterium]